MKSTRFSSHGFSLVEVTLALGVAAFSFLAIFGLFATGLQVHHTAIEQTASGDILTAVAADLRATPKTTPPGGPATSAQFGLNIPASGSTATLTLYFDAVGQPSASPTSTSTYRLRIKFLSNGGGRTASFVDLRMTWPAAANPTSPSTSAAETFLALDRN